MRTPPDHISTTAVNFLTLYPLQQRRAWLGKVLVSGSHMHLPSIRKEWSWSFLRILVPDFKFPWKDNSPPLPTNYTECERRTRSMVGRLADTPDKIISEQETRGFCEKVYDAQPTDSALYIPRLDEGKHICRQHYLRLQPRTRSCCMLSRRSINHERFSL